MVEIGRTNRLTVVKCVDFGVYLDGGDLGEILLPKRYHPSELSVGDSLDVFVYLDSDDRLIATTEVPKVQVDECAYLEVVAVNRVGAFLDWGLPKDLLVPFSEQQQPMRVGQRYVVTVCVDDSGRIVASSKLHRHLKETSIYFQPDQAVDLLICARTDLGYKAVIDNSHLGLIYREEVFQPIKIGQRLTGYIKAIRSDHKIDLCLQLPGQRAREELSERIIQYLEQNGGRSKLTDKCSPDEIYNQFGVSKGAYKRALGALYKREIIRIEQDAITLVKCS